jgi:hypothetical protein
VVLLLLLWVLAVHWVNRLLVTLAPELILFLMLSQQSVAVTVQGVLIPAVTEVLEVERLMVQLTSQELWQAERQHQDREITVAHQLIQVLIEVG